MSRSSRSTITNHLKHMQQAVLSEAAELSKGPFVKKRKIYRTPFDIYSL